MQRLRLAIAIAIALLCASPAEGIQPFGIGIPGPMHRLSATVIKAFDFTALSAGACTLPSGLSFSRASSGYSVQTGTTTVATSGGFTSNDAPRCGRRLDADPIGAVIEESRTNQIQRSADIWNAYWTSFGGATNAGTMTAPDGTSGGAGIISDATSGAYGMRYVTINMSGITHITSSWSRYVSGSVAAMSTNDSPFPIGYGTTSGAWERFSPGSVLGGGGSQLVCLGGGGNPLNIANTGVAAFWGMQLEAGAWMSELIPTSGATATRAGERLYLASAVSYVASGRLGFEVSLRPKASPANYAGAIRLWTRSTDYAEISTAGALTISIGGSTNTTAAASFAWTAYDTVQIFIGAGGSSASVVSYRVNGGSVVHPTVTGSALGSVSTGGALDLLCSSTSSQFSAWVTRLAFWKGAAKPSWAWLTAPAMNDTSMPVAIAA
jgi:hypothetical protein